jgi:hypothetical protein
MVILIRWEERRCDGWIDGWVARIERCRILLLNMMCVPGTDFGGLPQCGVLPHVPWSTVSEAHRPRSINTVLAAIVAWRRIYSHQDSVSTNTNPDTTETNGDLDTEMITTNSDAMIAETTNDGYSIHCILRTPFCRLRFERVVDLRSILEMPPMTGAIC